MEIMSVLVSWSGCRVSCYSGNYEMQYGKQNGEMGRERRSRRSRRR